MNARSDFTFVDAPAVSFELNGKSITARADQTIIKIA